MIALKKKITNLRQYDKKDNVIISHTIPYFSLINKPEVFPYRLNYETETDRKTHSKHNLEQSFFFHLHKQAKC